MSGFPFRPVELVSIAAGGALGSLCRALTPTGNLAFFDYLWLPPSFTVNLLGTLALALLYMKQAIKHNKWFFLTSVGFCGSYTTVSGMAYEVVQRLHHGQLFSAIIGTLLLLISSLFLVGILLHRESNRS
jgi:CrcB protein